MNPTDRTEPLEHTAESAEARVTDAGAQAAEAAAQRMMSEVEDTSRPVVTEKNGVKHTRWPDGVERLEKPDGSGYVQRPSEYGITIQHWGRTDKENYTESRLTDGTVRRECKDGTGFVLTRQADGTIRQEAWGPRDADNYVATRDARGTEHIRRKDGSWEFSYINRLGMVVVSSSDSAHSYGKQQIRVGKSALQQAAEGQMREHL